MGFRPYRTQSMYGNIRRQQTIQLIYHQRTIQRLFGIKVCHHKRCMYSCVCSPCTCHIGLSTQQNGKGTFQTCLHAFPIGLYLPPVIVGSVV